MEFVEDKAIRDVAAYVNSCREVTKGTSDFPIKLSSEDFVDAISWVTNNLAKYAQPYMFLLTRELAKEDILTTVQDKLWVFDFPGFETDAELVYFYFKTASKAIKKASVSILHLNNDLDDMDQSLCKWWTKVKTVVELDVMVHALKLIYHSTYDDRRADVSMMTRFNGIIDHWQRAQWQVDRLLGYPVASEAEVVVNGAAFREFFNICAQNHSRYPAFFLQRGFDMFLLWCSERYVAICDGKVTGKDKNLYRFPCLVTFKEWWGECGSERHAYLQIRTVLDGPEATNSRLFGPLKQSRFNKVGDGQHPAVANTTEVNKRQGKCRNRRRNRHCRRNRHRRRIQNREQANKVEEMIFADIEKLIEKCICAAIGSGCI
ncbi:hypothetical protein DIURU_000527 [Diutina rugosa]|uniref:Uncharacterized protein n=1 Tax=Diutina rugosa TaxID=5481 RepID=A0A642UXT6_DIURU|nr:uncharacterized protein DIURU_000527 [Diutina rugosa]KAA8907482.1 hypothetical protein DIURU_000527 [Diutina rugosa]